MGNVPTNMTSENENRYLSTTSNNRDTPQRRPFETSKNIPHDYKEENSQERLSIGNINNNNPFELAFDPGLEPFGKGNTDSSTLVSHSQSSLNFGRIVPSTVSTSSENDGFLNQNLQEN